MDVIAIEVRDGHVAAEQTYVYCWFHPADGKIMYVGATWLHPAARAELHLHGDDPASRVVGNHLEMAGIAPDTPLKLLAFAVTGGMERARLRTLLIAELSAAGMLSNTYFGFPVEAPAEATDPTYAAWLAEVITRLKDR